MSGIGESYQQRGCSIGSEIATGADPLLVPTEPDALFEHWRRMAMITLQAEPVDVGKLEFSVKRMKFWRERMSKK